jgi:hypothetical protein
MLRQLAAALCTTSAALLGAGQEASPGRDPGEACWGSAGLVERVLQPAEMRKLREDCDLRPWPAGEHDLFVRIVPGQLTGRRIRSQ